MTPFCCGELLRAVRLVLNLALFVVYLDGIRAEKVVSRANTKARRKGVPYHFWSTSPCEGSRRRRVGESRPTLTPTVLGGPTIIIIR